MTRKWYKPDPPAHDDWQKIAVEIYVMEQLTFKIRTKEEQCRRKWEKCSVCTSTTGQGLDTDANIKTILETSWQSSVLLS